MTPAEAVVGGGGAHEVEELVGYAGRAHGVLVHVDPEAFGFDEAAGVGIDAGPHGAPPRRDARAPAADAQLGGPGDGLEDVDDGAADYPVRVRVQGVHMDQVVDARVLEVAGDAVDAQILVLVHIDGAEPTRDVEDVPGVRDRRQRQGQRVRRDRAGTVDELVHHSVEPPDHPSDWDAPERNAEPVKTPAGTLGVPTG
nr:hypothetical protein [Nocardia seriolae]